MSDRSASFRGEICPSSTQRIVSEAFEVTRKTSSRWWWEPIRRSFLRVAGVEDKVMDIAVRWSEKWDGSSNGEVMPNDKQKQVAMSAHKDANVVVSYIVRQPPRRSLRPADHLVSLMVHPRIQLMQRVASCEVAYGFVQEEELGTEHCPCGKNNQGGTNSDRRTHHCDDWGTW